ncbi:MAG: HlyD family efflux transporter periplasmic adaptor subunit [Bacteroidales bacterium]|jgi:hypothetical protein|nr:HlyD family efflux transporter periplasmic adaptor subunit [Bacteroidales bacterium]MDD3272817.1 HlyD family efflux transporter periplasmic adaptor subunit [Bacteroidales bacterium]
MFIVFQLIFNGCVKQEDVVFYGNFEADEIILPSTGAGRLVELYANEGDLCYENDLLAVVDTTILSLERSKVKSSLKALQEMGMFSQLEPLRYDLRIIEEKLKMCYIKSPKYAKILKINFKKGEYLFEGTPFISIVDENKIFFTAWVPGSHLSLFSVGDSVCVLSDLPNKQLSKHKGKIISVSERPQFVPSMVQTRENRVEHHYRVKVELPNNGSLKGGMPGEMIP